MTKPLTTGYAMRGELNRAINANRAAQGFLRRILNEQPGPQAQAMLIARVAASLGENLESLMAMHEIVSLAGNGSKP